MPGFRHLAGPSAVSVSLSSVLRWSSRRFRVPAVSFKCFGERPDAYGSRLGESVGLWMTLWTMFPRKQHPGSQRSREMTNTSRHGLLSEFAPRTGSAHGVACSRPTAKAELRHSDEKVLVCLWCVVPPTKLSLGKLRRTDGQQIRLLDV